MFAIDVGQQIPRQPGHHGPTATSTVDGVEDGVLGGQIGQGPGDFIGPASPLQQKTRQIRRDITVGRGRTGQEQETAVAPAQQTNHHLVATFRRTAGIHQPTFSHDEGSHLGRLATF